MKNQAPAASGQKPQNQLPEEMDGEQQDGQRVPEGVHQHYLRTITEDIQDARGFSGVRPGPPKRRRWTVLGGAACYAALNEFTNLLVHQVFFCSLREQAFKVFPAVAFSHDHGVGASLGVWTLSQGASGRMPREFGASRGD